MRVQNRFTFETVDQNLWGIGNAFVEDIDEFIGATWSETLTTGSVSIVSLPLGINLPKSGIGVIDKTLANITSTGNIDVEAEFGLKTDGKVGFDVGFMVDSGSVDAVLPVDVVLELGSTAGLDEDDFVDLSIDVAVLPGGGFSTNFPEVQTYLDLVYDVYAQAFGAVDVDWAISGPLRTAINGYNKAVDTWNNAPFTPDVPRFNVPLSGDVETDWAATLIDVNETEEVFAFNRDGDGEWRIFGEPPAGFQFGEPYELSYSVDVKQKQSKQNEPKDGDGKVDQKEPAQVTVDSFDVPFGEVTLTIPDIEVTSTETRPGVYTGSGKTETVATLLDVDGVATIATSGFVPPLEQDLSATFRDSKGILELGAGVEYNLFDIESGPALPVSQDFSWEAEVETNLKFSEPVTLSIDGKIQTVTETGWLSGSADLEIALGDSSVDVTAEHRIDNTFFNTTSLGGRTDLIIEALSAGLFANLDINLSKVNGALKDVTAGINLGLGPLASIEETLIEGKLLDLFNDGFSLGGFQTFESDFSIPATGPDFETIDVFRFFNTLAGGHFFTTNPGERKFVLETLPSFNAENVGFEALAADSDAEGAVPVFRFFNTKAGGHFFTTDPSERDFVEETLPQFQPEGVGFLAFEAEVEGSIPVYRFFNTQAGGHFFTADPNERDFVQNNLPNFQDEGVGFYAFPDLF
ncbi:MAG: hypothetical protein GVY13_06005 [Alphaproteobacteria bacterium]|jgi:hypothetical protein|nr:hypothetical protein [Alphaproteobacteria bacterium]